MNKLLINNYDQVVMYIFSDIFYFKNIKYYVHLHLW